MLHLFLSGGPVMYPLLACSVIVLTVIIERLMFWNRIDRMRNQAVVDDILELSRAGDWEAIRRRARDFDIPYSRAKKSRFCQLVRRP